MFKYCNDLLNWLKVQIFHVSFYILYTHTHTLFMEWRYILILGSTVEEKAGYAVGMF